MCTAGWAWGRARAQVSARAGGRCRRRAGRHRCICMRAGAGTDAYAGAQAQRMQLRIQLRTHTRKYMHACPRKGRLCWGGEGVRTPHPAPGRSWGDHGEVLGRSRGDPGDEGGILVCRSWGGVGHGCVWAASQHLGGVGQSPAHTLKAGWRPMAGLSSLRRLRGVGQSPARAPARRID